MAKANSRLTSDKPASNTGSNREAESTTEEAASEAGEESTTNENFISSIEFGEQEQPTTKRGRGRPRKEGGTTKETRSTKTRKTPSKEEKDRAAKIAAELLEKAEDFGTEATGNDATFTTFERTLIEPALTSMLASVQTDAFERYGKILNPLVLLLGLFMWFWRIQPKGEIRNVNAVTRPVTTQSGEAEFHREGSNQYNSEYDSQTGNLFA